MSDIREELRDILSGWPIGSGYYSTSVAVDEASEMADAIIARFPWIAEEHEQEDHYGTARYVTPWKETP